MEISKSTISYWRTISTDPVKLLDSIVEHGGFTSEFAELLDSVAQKFEELEDELVAVTQERDNVIRQLWRSENEVCELESQLDELSDRLVDLEEELEHLKQNPNGEE